MTSFPLRLRCTGAGGCTDGLGTLTGECSGDDDRGGSDDSEGESTIYDRRTPELCEEVRALLRSTVSSRSSTSQGFRGSHRLFPIGLQ